MERGGREVVTRVAPLAHRRGSGPGERRTAYHASAAMNVDVVHHFPSDLFEALVDGLPLLVKGKSALINLFRGAGAPAETLSAVQKTVAANRDSIRKHEIARQVVEHLNKGGDRPAYLRARRELLKRVVEWEDFSTCYPENVLKAKGFVAGIRQRIEMKDAFTRMAQAREAELESHRKRQDQQAKEAANRLGQAEAIHREFNQVFTISEPARRGRALETVLNRLFMHHGILVRDSFCVRNPESGRVTEQIDGVVELRARLCLVEVKFCGDPPGAPEITHHIGRLTLHGGNADGLYVSANGFASTAIATVREAVAAKYVIGLCSLADFVPVFEGRCDLEQFLRERLEASILKDDASTRTRGRRS